MARSNNGGDTVRIARDTAPEALDLPLITERFPALEALMRRASQILEPRVRHHPSSPDELEKAIATLKRMGATLLGWEPAVYLSMESGRFVADVTARSVLVSDHERPLQLLCVVADSDLLRKHPDFDWEFRVHGKRFADLNHGHAFSKTVFHFEDSAHDIAEIAFKVELAIENRFGAPPVISVYEVETQPRRFAIHVSPSVRTDEFAFAGRLRSLSDHLAKAYPFAEFSLLVGGRPLERGNTLPPQTAGRDLFHLEEFSPELPRM